MENKKELNLYFENGSLSIRIVSTPELADIVIGKDGEISIKMLKEKMEEITTYESLLETSNLETVEFETSEDNKNEDLDITQILTTLGMPANIKGYYYCREAIKMILANPETLHAVTKTLYPDIAKKFDTTPSRVERAVRHAIEVSSTRTNSYLFDKLFSYSEESGKRRPTNAEFLGMIAEHYRLAGIH